VKAGYQLDLASPGAVFPTMDKKSLDPKVVGDEIARQMRSYLDANAARIEHPLVLADVDTSTYDAVVVPGGHGPVEDLYKDPDMGRVLVEADEQSKVIAAACRGPAAFLAAKAANGNWPFAGRRMTSLSDEEEIQFGTADNAPWLLAATLREKGAKFEQGPDWGTFVVTNGNLLTGQNPQSSAELAKAVIAKLG
jgi:putative intracellular protease/amidase